jgi:hypothetical protein
VSRTLLAHARQAAQRGLFHTDDGLIHAMVDPRPALPADPEVEELEEEPPPPPPPEVPVELPAPPEPDPCAEHCDHQHEVPPPRQPRRAKAPRKGLCALWVLVLDPAGGTAGRAAGGTAGLQPIIMCQWPRAYRTCGVQPSSRPGVAAQTKARACPGPQATRDRSSSGSGHCHHLPGAWKAHDPVGLGGSCRLCSGFQLGWSRSCAGVGWEGLCG